MRANNWLHFKDYETLLDIYYKRRISLSKNKFVFIYVRTLLLFTEWKIGTQEGIGDIFPAVKVGQNTSGSSAIVHGKLELNRKSVNKTVSEFKDTQNMTMEEIQNQTSSTTDQERAFFYMEPGRCIYQSLYAIGYSHLKSKLRSKTVCIKRKLELGNTY